MDERALQEIYLRAFELTIRDGNPWAVMSAYNRINGVFASENPWLLTDVLREEWGYDGVVISDWGAVHDPVAAAARRSDPAPDRSGRGQLDGSDRGACPRPPLPRSRELSSQPDPRRERPGRIPDPPRSNNGGLVRARLRTAARPGRDRTGGRSGGPRAI